MRHRWTWWPFAGTFALGGALLLMAAGAPRAGKAKGDHEQPPPAPRVPVVVATARQGDVPVYLTGLGAVTALKTVNVRTRVDGQLMRVLFVEGQTVSQGAL